MGKPISLSIALLIFLILFLSSCTQLEFDRQYCEVDTDCVRQDSCCDCGLGTYVNKEYYENADCDEECDCEAQLSEGLCVNNTCVATPLDKVFCDEEKGYIVGDTWENSRGQECRCQPGAIIDCGTDSEKLQKEQASEMLDEYYENVDYSCETDRDCTLKDVHNCCGYYPQCVNTEFVSEPGIVDELCEVSERSGVCGFPTINGCQCIDGKCQGII